MKFEDAGRTIDHEIAKLVEFLERKAKPKTRRELTSLLRKASDRMAKLADSLEKTEH